MSWIKNKTLQGWNWLRKHFKKVLIAIAGTGIAVASFTVPVGENQMEWVVSYETVEFETTDGDLGIGDYALSEDELKYYVRSQDKDKGQFESVLLDYDVSGMNRVYVKIDTEKIRNGEYAYTEDKSGYYVREKKFESELDPGGQNVTSEVWGDIVQENLSYDVSKLKFRPLKEIYKRKYYSEFSGSNGIERVVYDETNYENLRTEKDYPKPSKTEKETILGMLVTPNSAFAAITQDATSSTSASSVTSVSWSHNNTGSTDDYLIVLVGTDDTNVDDGVVSSATYNSISMNFLRSDNRFTQGFVNSVLYMHNPSSGNNTISVTFAGTVSDVGVGAVSLEGVDQVNSIDAEATANGSSADATVNITTVADNSWVFSLVVTDELHSNSIDPGSGQTELFDIDGNGENFNINKREDVSPAGSTTMNTTWTGTEGWVITAVSIKPAVYQDEGWCDTSYSNRELVSIRAGDVDGDLSNYPLWVAFTSTATSTMQTDGDDVFFTDFDECASDDPVSFVKIDFELQDADSDVTTGNPGAWVKVSSVASSTDTSLYMYYGNGSATDNSSSTAPWDSDYLAVYHLEETPDTDSGTDEFLDSTSNNNDADSENLDTGAQVGGIVGGSIDFDAHPSEDRILRTSINTASAYTWCHWINGDNAPSATTEQSFTNGHTSDSYGFSWGHSNAAFRNAAYHRDSGGSYESAQTNTLSADTWYLLCATWNGTTITMYEDGANVDTGSDTTIQSISGDLRIGNAGNVGGNEFNGTIDEVRLSDIARSSEWMKMRYRNEAGLFDNPFFGAQQSSPVASVEGTSDTIIIH